MEVWSADYAQKRFVLCQRASATVSGFVEGLQAWSSH